MSMICLAIIVDETVSVIGKKGKNKLRECRCRMFQKDIFTLTCRKGHIRKTEEWSVKGHEAFYGIAVVRHM